MGANVAAGRHAAMWPNTPWPLGDSDDIADEPDGAIALALTEAPRDAARIHQEDANHAAIGSGNGVDTAERAGAMSREHMGSSIDDFLKEEGIFEEAQTQAVKEVVAWRLAKAMKKRKISKRRMAVLLKTSRSQVNRLLDPKSDMTLGSLQRAAAVVGCRVNIELL